MHWPKGWAEKNLPGLQRLKRHGLYFNRAYTAVTQCSPSRALMMQTGRFAPVNRVTQTLLWPGLVHQEPPARQPRCSRKKPGTGRLERQMAFELGRQRRAAAATWTSRRPISRLVEMEPAGCRQLPSGVDAKLVRKPITASPRWAVAFPTMTAVISRAGARRSRSDPRGWRKSHRFSARSGTEARQAFLSVDLSRQSARCLGLSGRLEKGRLPTRRLCEPRYRAATQLCR